MQLFNEGFSGGLKIVVKNETLASDDAEHLSLYVGGLECRAQEHRFGGVVVQPVDAWKAENKSFRVRRARRRRLASPP